MIQVKKHPCVVQAQTATHVPTGIPELDDLIEGGFLPNSSILLRGESGSGAKTGALNFFFSRTIDNICAYHSRRLAYCTRINQNFRNHRTVRIAAPKNKIEPNLRKVCWV